MDRLIRYGMLGGDPAAFIGNVHRHAIDFSGRCVMAAGCFHVDPEKNLAAGRLYRVAEDRIYSDYKAMAAAEAAREDKIDFVSICTPNFLHYEMAKAFLEAGINVVCEKPLCFEVAQAQELQALAKEKDLLFAVTYCYSGNAMVKLARQLVEEGKLGKIVNVNAEYPQDWLIDELDDSASSTSKMPVWRMDPKFSGASNCVGDIGTHIEHTVHYITGLHVKRVAAKVDYFDHPLDLNANVLIEYDNGASGSYWCSQIAAGHRNGLAVRIYGSKGSLEWHEEDCEYLRFTPKGEPTQILCRGCGYVTGRAAQVQRVPSGHPEGFYESFANVYASYISAIAKHIDGQPLDAADLDFPTVDDGLAGVKYVHAVVDSARADSAWTEIK